MLHQPGSATLDIDRWDVKENVEQFVDGKCSILVHRAFPNRLERQLLKQRLSIGEDEPQRWVAAYGNVAVIVNLYNPVRSVTLNQVKQMLRMDKPISLWKELDGGRGGIKFYGEKRDDP